MKHVTFRDDHNDEIIFSPLTFIHDSSGSAAQISRVYLIIDGSANGFILCYLPSSKIYKLTGKKIYLYTTLSSIRLYESSSTSNAKSDIYKEV